MMKCPRCGFEQPPDEYCAQCGVNMETYREKHRPSFFKMLINDSRLQVTALILIALTSFVFLYNQQFQKIESRISLLQGQLQIASSDALSLSDPEKTDAEAPPTEDTNTESIANSEQAPTPDETLAKSIVVTDATTGKIEKTIAAETPATTLKPNEHELRVIYAEVPRKILMEIFEESQAIGQFIEFEDYQAGIVTEFEKRIEQKELVVLNEEKKLFQINQPLNWFVGIKDRQDLSMKIGFEVFLEFQLGEGSWKGNLDMQRSWREPENLPPNPPISRRNFPAVFELNPKSVFFMSGFLPRRSNLPDESGLLEIPVYKILKSVPFIQGRSEFVIFYEVLR